MGARLAPYTDDKKYAIHHHPNQSVGVGPFLHLGILHQHVQLDEAHVLLIADSSGRDAALV